MNKLIIMCGVIGSGKTTWIQNYLKDHPDTLVVSKDDIRRMLHGGKYVYDEQLEDLVEHIFCSGIDAEYLTNCDTIVLDECNITRSDRDISILDGIKTIVYCPPKDKKYHVDRRMKDSYGVPREVWEEVYDKMMAKLEPPTENECDELIVIGDSSD